jgi:hypothetical protein
LYSVRMAIDQRLERHIETIARWIIESERIVAFTGAGISTDSGILTFVAPKGYGQGAMRVCRRRGGGFHWER